MDPTIRWLEDDLQAAHANIVQYLWHAYRFGEGELAAEIEEIAREEMRHLWWLAEAIVRRGGDPSLARGPLVRQDTAAEFLRWAVGREEADLERCRQHRDQTTDPAVRLVLDRIIADEVHHRQAFQELLTAVENGTLTLAPRPATVPDGLAETVALLNQAIRFEYTAVLQYLYQSFFVTTDCDLYRELFNTQAQESMKHLGWLAETVAALGGEPLLEFDPIDRGRDPARFLAINLRLEEEAVRLYREWLPRLADPRARAVMERIYAQEQHHVREFQLLHQPTPTGLTVGSLFGRPQWGNEEHR